MAEATRRKPLLIPAALLATVLLCAVLAWMIESRASILRDGEQIVLRTAPIDPRDLLRGHFVRLDYPAERIAGEPLHGLAEALGDRSWRHETVYVTFETGADGVHMPASVSLDEPAVMPFLRGSVRSFDPGDQMLVVDYGIDRFYADEFRAPELERNMREGMVTEIVVAIGDDGTAQIKALRQQGVVIVTEPPY